LLRLINTSFGTTFVFSIDHHKLTVSSADFVPIHNYTTKSVLIGIGQRYNIIVEADPISYGVNSLANTNGNFWIRTHVADCPGPENSAYLPGYEKAGILRYNGSSTALPETTQWSDIPLRCSDEPYENLIPVHKWTVGDPANRHFAEEFDVTKNFTKYNPDQGPNKPFPMATFALEPSSDTKRTRFTPLRIDFGNITFLHLNNTGAWPKQWVVIPEDYTDTDWVS
jgi:FtsP/CotA-like multicopper oxidase with cupredoxin domain